MRNSNGLRIGLGLLVLAALAAIGPLGTARADVLEVPAYAPPPVDAGPGWGPISDRFSPVDVAAGPPVALFAPAPPSFGRFACDTYTCGGGGGIEPILGVVESPASPGTLPGFGSD